MGLLASNAAAETKVDYARDVRPILSRYCFKCHGPDNERREAGLRLDVREAALAAADSGEHAIVAGKPDASELLKRVQSDDEDVVMPPPETKQSLTAEQVAILRRWIAEGAEYAPHWAFIAPQQPQLPQVKQADWPANAIDYFVLARLEQAGLAPSADADRYTIARRVYLDLIGLPPTPQEAQAFVDDRRPDAYEQLVDRLLASPAYGERWARKWLDLARYADTNGYEKDRVRSIWPYRDWVIEAINDDMPFDQFTIEQLAGDMLPGATVDQRIATGFHRNTMINEEGGIDPLEFRYYSVVDRINTTATTWLGLTLGCAQCHTHKFDPVPHHEYFAMMAYLNNSDEPELSVPQSDIVARRQQLLGQIAQHEADLPKQFAQRPPLTFTPYKPDRVESLGKANTKILDDHSVLLSGENPESDTLRVTLTSTASVIAGLRLEALADETLPSRGPGRTPHGNFVLSEIDITVAADEPNATAQQVAIASASADFEQQTFPAAHTLDGNPQTGWAIHGPGEWNVDRTATFTFKEPLQVAAGAKWTITLKQNYGKQHTIGRFRLSLGTPAQQVPAVESPEVAFNRSFNAWQIEARKKATRWHVLQPQSASSGTPVLTILDDRSVIASGDMTKRDIYSLRFGEVPEFSAIRLEALPDEGLPKGGPGRIYYEGPAGDFFLSQISGFRDGEALAFRSANQTYASGGSTAEKAIDDDPQSGWSINGGQGRAHAAVFGVVPVQAAKTLQLDLLFERYYAAGLGRFRIAVSADPQAASAVHFPAAVNDALIVEPAERTDEQTATLRRYYLSIAPEVAAQRAAIDQLRQQLPALPTTLVMNERPQAHPRATFRMHRGEFLQPKEQVEASVLSCLNLPLQDKSNNRLAFARWLVDQRHPLTARVIVNRHWGYFFGRGIVRTTEDFGLQGELPSHPQLLDWLATDLMRSDWSMKTLHRQIVLSRTYRQATTVTKELAERDPQNILLARGARVRLDGEAVRDYALAVSGLLSRKQGGPSVFPPQPPGITTEGAYGALAWNVSPGEDRYRRGLYTFAKRTAPFAMLSTFDGPTGEACVPRREISNTPLQALVLLNDEVFLEAAQALGRMTAAIAGDDQQRATQLFTQILVRPPTEQETARMLQFVTAQRDRIEKQAIDAAKIAGPGDGSSQERALWTLLARALLNLDEAVTKE